MRLVKIEDGLIEQDNFFEVSPFSEFLGDFQYSRESGEFTLKSGFIERRFPYNEYVIVVEKENTFINDEDEIYFYTRKDQFRSGLVESKEGSVNGSLYWKLIKYDGFVQGYSSNDAILWEHKGGGEISETDIQGLHIEGDTELIIKDYRVYKNPYLTIHGLDQGTIAILENNFGDIISRRHFGADSKCEIFLDYPLNGRLRFINPITSEVIFESNLLDFKYGDSYSLTNFNLEIYYKGQLLDYTPATLGTLRELVIVKNVSTEIYTDLHFRVISMNSDVIQIGFDDVDYHDALILPSINPDEEVKIYIKIEKDRTQISYGTRHFVLEID